MHTKQYHAADNATQNKNVLCEGINHNKHQYARYHHNS